MNERDKVIWSEAAKATEGAGDSWDAQVAFMQKFADLIRADEREACAKVCYELPWKDMGHIPSNLAFAAAIRTRSDK